MKKDKDKNPEFNLDNTDGTEYPDQENINKNGKGSPVLIVLVVIAFVVGAFFASSQFN